MGCAELMASVVSGIAKAPEPFGAAWTTGASATAATARCGTAALAACSFTSRESTTTDTTGKNKISHRIFMKTSVFAEGWNHTAGGRTASSQVVRTHGPSDLFRSREDQPYRGADEACAIPFPPTILECSSKPFITTMKTTLSFSTPAEIETESLVAIALDHSEKDATATKPSESGKKE